MLMYQEVLPGGHHANESLKVPCMALNAAWNLSFKGVDGGTPARRYHEDIWDTAGLGADLESLVAQRFSNTTPQRGPFMQDLHAGWERFQNGCTCKTCILQCTALHSAELHGQTSHWMSGWREAVNVPLTPSPGSGRLSLASSPPSCTGSAYDPEEGDDRPLFDIVSPEFDKHILETWMSIDDIARARSPPAIPSDPPGTGKQQEPVNLAGNCII
ncbi:hypothetical protein NA56DRAFT_704019 [Hyaloscypha hepaticicola]|uniref:Uncharacterized protein n=1 Tax=Hyaloscypha hepaticicola TaxID=2082293 RepID=A0A2J6Q3D6_9HELO|nr:hypothetical protein NA56DRAFT_704019 [Hyaloscypha hepaticicola]